MLQLYFARVSGPQTYTTFQGADSLRLCHFDTVRGHIRDDKADGTLLPKYTEGINEGIIEKFASKWYAGHLCDTAGDGTRGCRSWERIGIKLIGHQFSPDCAEWKEDKTVFYVPQFKAELIEMLSIIRKLDQLTAEIHTEQLRCTTCRKPPMAYAVIPEASQGNSGFLNFKYWMRLLDSVSPSVLLKDFITDMCSCGLLGGKIMMTPNEGFIALGCSYVGLPVDDYKYFSLYCEPMVNGKPPLPHSWVPESAHLARLLQNNLDSLSYLPFFSVSLTDLEGAIVAHLGHLKLLSAQRGDTGLSLKHIGVLNEFANFNNDSAFYMVSAPTIGIIKECFPQEVATYIALLSFHFLMEVYRNPAFTNPLLAVEYVWRAQEIWRLQDVYVREVLELSSPSDCLPSYQFFDAVEISACVATNHFLSFHLTRKRVGLAWDQCSMSEKNGDMLEGTHSQGRHQKNGNID